jgi:methionyl-tRNA formyltransferase
VEKKYPFTNIIVLSSLEFANDIIASFRQVDPEKDYLHIDSLSELNLLSTSYLKSARLISFITKIIVPKNILDVLGYQAFNFHPGPPQYPGWAPYSFALYEGAKSFGITVHQMTEEVDAGPIIAVEQFPLAPNLVQVDLERMCLASCLGMLNRLIKIFVDPNPIDPINIEWATKRTFQKDFKEKCHINRQMPKKEFHNILRSFGSGDGHHVLYMEENDARYILNLSTPQEQITDYIKLHGVRFERVI